MKIPEKPREIIRFITIIGIIGSLPTLIIHFLSMWPFWSNIKPWFSSEAWSYLNWWATIYPEPTATFLAIYVAFAVENRNIRRHFQKRVQEILPHIYIELLENHIILKEAQDDFRDYIKVKKMLHSENWSIFKNEISKWQEINVIPLTKIYHGIEQINQYVRYGPIDYTTDLLNIRDQTIFLTLDQIKLYENWFKEHKIYADELKKAIEIYRKRQTYLETRVLEWVDKIEL